MNYLKIGVIRYLSYIDDINYICSPIFQFCKEYGMNNLNIEFAAKHGNLEIIKYLTKQNNSCDNWRIIIRAAENGYFKVVKYLIKLGISCYCMRIENPDNNQTFGCFIDQNISNGFLDNIAHIISVANNRYDYKISEHVIDQHDTHSQIVKLLTERFGLLDVYCIIYAAEDGSLEAIKYLVKKDM